jgi:hypothetical protein
MQVMQVPQAIAVLLGLVQLLVPMPLDFMCQV